MEMRNFRHHVHTVIDFGPGITAIIGPNGTGKSTAIEALEWAPFGSYAARGTNEDLKFDGAASGEPCFVEKTFRLMGHEFVIHREPGGATIRRDGQVVASGSDACVEYIEELWGMNRKEAENTIIARQRSLEWCAGMGGADRERFIAKTLGYGKLKDAQTTARQRRTKLDGKIELLEHRIGDAPPLDELDRRISEAASSVEDAKATLSLRKEDVKVAESKKASVLEEVKALREKSDADREMAKEIEELKDRRSKVVESAARGEQKMETLEETASSLPDLSAKREFLKEQVADLKAAEKELSESVSTLRSKKTKKTDACVEAKGLISTLVNRRTSAEGELRNLTEVGGDEGVCPTCRQELGQGWEEAVEEARSKIEKLNGEIEAAKLKLEEARSEEDEAVAKLKEAERRLDSVKDDRRQSESSLATAQDRVVRAEKAKAELEKVREGLKDVRSRIKSLNESIKSLKDERGELAFDRELHREKEKHLEEIDSKLETARQAASKAEKHLSTTEAALESLQADKRRITENQEALKQARHERLVAEATDGMFGDLRRWLNDRIRPELSALASESLTIMSSGRFTELRLNDQYEPVIFEGARRIKTPSGGEGDIANLALRIGQSRMIGARSGTPINVMMLDEVFAALDSDRERLVMESLLSLSEQGFGQIVLVTHEQSVSDMVDTVLMTDFDEATGATRLVNAGART